MNRIHFSLARWLLIIVSIDTGVLKAKYQSTSVVKTTDGNVVSDKNI